MRKQPVTTFYIVRHGETDWNKQKLIQGQIDIPLNSTGEKQAEEVAKQFNSINFDLVISSDLVRAKRTAEIITLEKKLAVETTKTLRERMFGELEGQPTPTFFAYLQLLKALSDEERRKSKANDEYESDEEVTTRVITFLRETAIANPGKTVLVTTHAGVLRLILIHLGAFTYQTLEAYRVKNLAHIKIESDGVDFFVKAIEGLEKVDRTNNKKF